MTADRRGRTRTSALSPMGRWFISFPPGVLFRLFPFFLPSSPKRYGFVDFDQPLTATIAIENLNGKELNGRVVELKPAITTREKQMKQALHDWEQRCLEEDRRVAQGFPRREVPLPPKKKIADFGFTVDQFLEMVGRTNSRTAKRPPTASEYNEEVGYDDDDEEDLF